jgi:hypothetical protein
MKKVTLIFPSIKGMWQFLRCSESSNFEIVYTECLLTGVFSEEEILKATVKQKATIRESVKN